MFRLIFLGTSSGMPTKSRNVSGIALECLGDDLHAKNPPWFLIDCGEGTQHQLLKTKLSPNRLSAILITHIHGDHCYGLFGLLASLGLHNRKTPLYIVAPKAIQKLLSAFYELTELYVNYPIIFLAIEDILTDDLEIANLQLEGLPNLAFEISRTSHRCPCYAFSIIQNLSKDKLKIDKLTAWQINNKHWSTILKAQDKSLPINIDGKILIPREFINHQQKSIKIVIAGDNDTPEILAPILQNAIALVHEATYTQEILQKILNKPADQGGFNPKHSSAEKVAIFAQKINLQNLILTHFSARFASFDDETSDSLNMAHIRKEAQKFYQNKLFLAQDLQQIIIDE